MIFDSGLCALDFQQAKSWLWRSAELVALSKARTEGGIQIQVVCMPKAFLTKQISKTFCNSLFLQSYDCLSLVLVSTILYTGFLREYVSTTTQPNSRSYWVRPRSRWKKNTTSGMTRLTVLLKRDRPRELCVCACKQLLGNLNSNASYLLRQETSRVTR